MIINNPHDYFYVKSGAVLKSLEEMIETLREMDEETFNHHVNNEKNDFATWTEKVLKEKGLAKKMYKELTKEGIIKLIEARIKAKKRGKRDKHDIIGKIKEAFTNE